MHIIGLYLHKDVAFTTGCIDCSIHSSQSKERDSLFVCFLRPQMNSKLLNMLRGFCNLSKAESTNLGFNGTFSILGQVCLFVLQTFHRTS